jgi:hypothetical protein
MNADLLSLVCEQVLGDSDDDLCFIVSLGWISADLRAWSRSLLRKTWKRLCVAHAVAGTICSSSVHRKDLSLTTRSRCYTANNGGYFEPHGGNGSDRCENVRHYYRNSLQPHWPSKHPDRRRDYVTLMLRKLASRHGAVTKQQEKLHTQRRKHRDACERLAECPWLLDEVEALLSQRRPLTAKTLERKRKFAELNC